MANKNNIVGLFNSYDNANKAVEELMGMGYTESDISVVTREDIVKRTTTVTGDPGETVAESVKKGGVIGGIVGLIAGLGALAIPGIGALLIAGPIAAAIGLTGAAATTAAGALTGIIAGGLVGALKSVGFDEVTAKRIEERIKEGDVLVMVVPSEGEENKVREVLVNNHADDVDMVNANLA